MCGVMGYVGRRYAMERLLDGLERLEYRGYDSSGVCLLLDHSLESVRAVGKLSNLKLKMAPRKFRVTKARKVGQAKSKIKFGSSISWSVNRAATMRIKVERLERLNYGATKFRRRAVGTIKKSAKKGKGTLKFSGLVGRKRLAPGSYRVVVTATAGGFTSASRTIKFTVVKG